MRGEEGGFGGGGGGGGGDGGGFVVVVGDRDVHREAVSRSRAVHAAASALQTASLDQINPKALRRTIPTMRRSTLLIVLGLSIGERKIPLLIYFSLRQF